ncbi:hypothetical protein LTR54_017329 [Friedmanniomyces endolithicus]|nr:hypothetical protein LTR54_017329 [Friedmanniomyces endolithicus]
MTSELPQVRLHNNPAVDPEEGSNAGYPGAALDPTPLRDQDSGCNQPVDGADVYNGLLCNNDFEDLNQLPRCGTGELGLDGTLLDYSLWCQPLSPSVHAETLVPDTRSPNCVEARSAPLTWDATHLLPAYIRPLPAYLTQEDLRYLHSKGALSTPEGNFRDELLKCYIEYVYPYMPTVELHSLLCIIDTGTGESGQVSLLLLQAIMFAGTTFVDMASLQAAGYKTRRAARKASYERVKVLYDSDVEDDRVAVVQSLLLMTYWLDTGDSQKDIWHWMGIATSLAHTIGLHRHPQTPHLDIGKRRLWKRIWWSCFMRDRLISLGLSRPPRIKHDDFDVPMLTLEDFEIEHVPFDSLSILKDRKILTDSGLETDLARMCIAMAKLCLRTNHVLAAYHDLVKDHRLARRHEDSRQSGVVLLPDRVQQVDKTQLCDIQLTEWARDLPAHCFYATSSTEELAGIGASFVIHRAVLHMVYLATVATLNKSRALPSVGMATLRQYHCVQAASFELASKASRDITSIVLDIVNLKLERFLPTSSLTFILPAIMIQVDDFKSSDEVVRMEALQGFCRCMQILDKLGESYPAADWAIHLVEDAISAAGVEVPVAANDSETEKCKGQLVAQNVSQFLNAGKSARLAEQRYCSGPPPSAPDSSIRRAETAAAYAEVPNNESDFTNLDEGELDHSFYSLTRGPGEGETMDAPWTESILEALMSS